MGLSVGADDYLTKPFSPARAGGPGPGDAAPPRAPAADPAVAGSGRWRSTRPAREVRVGGHPVELTRTEFDLLDTLSAQPRVVFSRRQLLEQVWGDDWYGDDHVIDVHVGNLRHKLGDDPAARATSARCAAWATGWAPADASPPAHRPAGGRLFAAQALIVVVGALTLVRSPCW